MCFILSFSCDFLNFFVISFVFLGNFSHLLVCFLIIFFFGFFFFLQVLQKAESFCCSVEISKFANFRNL